MSNWTYISGQVTVVPSGQGNHAKRFVLEEVLEHLPRVPGSEGPMSWHIIQKHGHDSSANVDEFGIRTNLSERGWWETQTTYIVVLEGALRDTYYEDTLKAFVKWLNRLSKRIWVEDMLVRVSGGGRQHRWNERIFSNAGHWRKNYWAYASRHLDKTDDLRRRHSVNWRYGFVPEEGFWPDILVNLLPGGKQLAHNLDLLLGNAEPEEYLDWNPKANGYNGIDPEILKFVEEGRKLVEAAYISLDNGWIWPGVDGGDES